MIYGNIDGNGLAELRNLNIQNLASAPTTGLKKGRFYFNTTDNTVYVYDGTNWIDALSQGDYTFQNGVELVSGTRNVQVKLGTSSNVTLTANASGLSASVADASTSAKGVIEIATDSEASTGTSEVLAINPKQLAIKVTANNAITGGSKTVVTYDSKGLVTGGSEIGIKSGSTNYLEFDTTNHQIGAKVDTTVTDSSTNLVTSGAVKTYVDNAVAGVIIPKGSIASTSGLPTLVQAHLGWMYNFSASFTTTSDFVEGAGIEYPTGTNVVVVEYEAGVYKYDVFSGFVDTSSFITASSTDTLTNKTLDADDNTISDLTASNLKSGVLLTSIRASSSASNTSWVSEKAVASALEGRVYSAQNTALTVSGGVCTWTVTHNLNNSNVSISVYEVSSGDKVMYDSSITSANVVTIKILSASNISANTYKVVIQG